MKTCETCKFWVSGQCRRHCPIVVSTEVSNSKKTTHWQESTHQVTCWPETKSWQGCGEHEEK